MKHSTRFGVSMIALTVATGMLPSAAYGQDGASADDDDTDVIVVRGIRGSLQNSLDIKRNSSGVVDAISAEDIGDFPDTNLAESLQRITGVSIDRQNGEGSQVTVRGFGPEFNLVTLNGRQMPTSNLEDTSASNERSFDFADLAAENISGVQVFKTGRASAPTGGVGSVINISTTRPLEAGGMVAALSGKAIIDTSPTDGSSVTPELSGIFSNTFSHDSLGTFGVAVSGSYQERDLGFAEAAATEGWRGPYLGSDNNWGTLPQIPDGGTEADIGVTNRPGPDDIYGVQQNLLYSLENIDRERINGQLALQWAPTDRITATFDYTYAENTVSSVRNELSIWYNFVDTTSAWTDGPVVGPVFYSEDFPADGLSDLSMGGGIFAVKSEDESIGFNIEWDVTDRLSLAFDYHDSSAESGKDSPYGSNAVIGTASFNILNQTIDYTQDLPVLSVVLDGTGEIDASRMLVTGSSFRDSFQRNDIKQAQFSGSYQVDRSIVDSLDFGVAYLENSYRSAFSNAQSNTWGGAGSPDQFPDDIFVVETLPDKFDAIDGSGNPALIDQFFVWDFARMTEIISGVDAENGNITVNGAAFERCNLPSDIGTGCILNDFTTDRRTEEESFSAYFQANTSFELIGMPAEITGGVRYEETDVVSRALVPIPSGTNWVAANEFNIVLSGESDFTELEGSYDYVLPAVDFRLEPRDDVVLRASYSESITRPNLEDIQGGLTVDGLFRIDGGNGGQGDPGLLPIESKNIDLSAEWYYKDTSYFSIGFFNKDVDNFIGTSQVQATTFSLPHPALGDRAAAAVAAGVDADDANAIRNWIVANTDPSLIINPDAVDDQGNTAAVILGDPATDPFIVFDVTVPVNERSTSVDGWEFALQHVFGDTGFGGIFNYTLVSGDAEYDVSLPPGADQFGLIGLSDTLNLVGFYEKNNLAVRAAYNWRDEFFTSTQDLGGNTGNPLFTEAYWQLDLSASYDLPNGVTLFFEGINVTNEYVRLIGRHPNQNHQVTQTGARYGIGARYRF